MSMAPRSKGNEASRDATRGATSAGVRRVLRGDGQSKRPKSSKDLFGAGVGGNRLKGEFSERADIHAVIQRRHEKGMGRIDGDGYWVEGDHRWKVPFGVRSAFRERLTFSMIASQYPFYVGWD